MGSETAGSIRNVTVKNCTFDGSGAAARLKSFPGRGGVVENITFSDLTVKNVQSIIDMRMNWGGDDWKKFVEPRFAAPVPPAKGTPIFRHVVLRNIQGTGKSAGTLLGMKNSLIDDVTFENVHLSAGTGMSIEYAKDMKLDGLKVEAKKGEAITKKKVE